MTPRCLSPGGGIDMGVDQRIRKVLSGTTLWCCLSITMVNSDTGSDSDNNLQSATEKLYCAADKHEAAHHIRSIGNSRLLTPGLPAESAVNDQPLLQATTLDQVLLVLHRTAEKFPEVKNLVEETVIQWNYCSVIDNGKFYDHRQVKGKSVRTPSPHLHDNKWPGFHAFGLVPGNYNSDSFNFTTPYINTSIRTLADVQLQQRYIAHCLPHPDDKHLYRADKRNFISRVQATHTGRRQFKPVSWNLSCDTPEPPPENQPEKQPEKQPENQLEKLTDNTVHQAAPETVQKPVQSKPAVPELTGTETQKIPELAAAGAPPATDTTQKGSAPEPVLVEIESITPAISPPGNADKTDTPESVPVFFETTEVDRDTQPQPAPVVVTAPSNGNSIVSVNTITSKGLSGSISIENRSFRIKDTSLKFNLGYKPVVDSYWFIRSALNVSQESQPFTYSWGIGYDDWHPGTWAIQLNHWGPLSPGDGLDIDNAVAEISYKLKSTWLKKNNLASTIALSKPVSDDPSLSWGWSWSPRSHWFIRSTLIKPLGEGGVNWSYGFGYTRYNANSLSFEYNNWGVNDFPEHNFRKNGQLSFIYRWAF